MDKEQESNSDDVSSNYVTERPIEAEVLEGLIPEPRGTVSPEEEGPHSRGFQHGSWKYEHDNTEKPLYGTIPGDDGELDTPPEQSS